MAAVRPTPQPCLSQISENLIGVFRRHHGVIHLGNIAVGVDQKAKAGRIGLVRLKHAIGGARDLIGVAQQIEWKGELFLKQAVFFRCVERSPQDYGILGCKVLDSITEPFAFNGSARCVGLWIPPQDHVVPLVLFQGGISPLLVAHGKGGCLIPHVW